MEMDVLILMKLTFPYYFPAAFCNENVGAYIDFFLQNAMQMFA